MKREDMIKFLQSLPEGTEIMIRTGDRCCPVLPVVLSNEYPDTTMTVYMSAMPDMLQDFGPVPAQLVKSLTDPYPKHLRQVCEHGRSISGTCGSCPSPEEDEDWEEELTDNLVT